MRVASLSYIGNEEDIVETFVRHTCRFADRMIIVSTGDDATRSILASLQEEGLPLTIIEHRPSYYDQEKMMTRLLHRYKNKADWFLFLDADELVTGDLRAVLERAPRAPLALRWKTYVPLPSDDHTQSIVPLRIRHRRTKEVYPLTKIIVPADIVTWRTHIAPGNHAVLRGTWCERGRALDDVALAHFPVRTARQLQSKIERGWPAVMRKPQRLPGEAFHWQRMHAQYAGKMIDADALTAIALRYSAPPDLPVPGIVEDPLPF